MRLSFNLSEEEYEVFQLLRTENRILCKCENLIKLEEDIDVIPNTIMLKLCSMGIAVKDYRTMWNIGYTITEFGKLLKEDMFLKN